MENTTLKDRRIVLRRILESQYSSKNELRLIELMFGNIASQDVESIKELKKRMCFCGKVNCLCGKHTTCPLCRNLKELFDVEND